MFSDVEAKIKRKNGILFNRESACLQPLRLQACEQTQLTLVLWSLDCARLPVQTLAQRVTDSSAPQVALDFGYRWAHGDIKMPIAKRAILDCHALAKGLAPYDAALCHAVGHACSSVHTEAHALGLVFYELTATVIKCGYKDFADAVSEKIDFYMNRLNWWQEKSAQLRHSQAWAAHLLRDKPNKESLR